VFPEAFVLRTRRVAEHSIARDETVLKPLRAGAFKVRKVGDNLTMIVDLPPEEQMESLAARVRPVICSPNTHTAPRRWPP